jgi:Uma2 family endonuclease
MTIDTLIRPLTTDDYHRMIQNGIIHEGEHVELILGQIVNMAAKGTRHTLCTRKIFKLLLNKIGDQADIQSQDPIVLSDRTEPEPDIVIARQRSDEYVNSHPTPNDIILIIEVADSTLTYDRQIKLPLYATAGIQEYWIVNLIDNRLEVYREPDQDFQGEGIYTKNQIYLPSKSIELPEFTDTTIVLADIFPPSKTD